MFARVMASLWFLKPSSLQSDTPPLFIQLHVVELCVVLVLRSDPEQHAGDQADARRARPACRRRSRACGGARSSSPGSRGVVACERRDLDDDLEARLGTLGLRERLQVRRRSTSIVTSPGSTTSRISAAGFAVRPAIATVEPGVSGVGELDDDRARLRHQRLRAFAGELRALDVVLLLGCARRLVEQPPRLREMAEVLVAIGVVKRACPVARSSSRLFANLSHASSYLPSFASSRPSSNSFALSVSAAAIPPDRRRAQPRGLAPYGYGHASALVLASHRIGLARIARRLDLFRREYTVAVLHDRGFLRRGDLQDQRLAFDACLTLHAETVHAVALSATTCVDELHASTTSV